MIKTKLLGSSVLASILIIISALPAFACDVTGTIVGQTQGSQVKFRPRPGAPTKSYVLVGQEVTILETGDEWVKVRYEPSGAVGWVHKNFVKYNCD